MDIKFGKTKTDILAWSIEDTISLFFVSSFVEQNYRYEDPELIKITSFAIIKNLLEENLVKAGALLSDNTFKPWNMSIDEIIDKIKQEWENLGRELEMYELVWFEITEKGRKEFEYLNSLPELKETDPFYFDDKES